LGFCGQKLLSGTLGAAAVMRNLPMVVPALGMPMMMAVVRGGAIRGLRLSGARTRQDRGNRQHEQCCEQFHKKSSLG
jgi:hypothetical protein